MEIARRNFLLSSAGIFANVGTMLSMTGEEPAIAKFKIAIPQEQLSDLKVRLHRIRWSDFVEGWSFGTDDKFLRRLVGHWVHAYDWREREAALNNFPHYRAKVGHFGIHFLHARSPNPDAKPLLLLNGWPSTFLEYTKVLRRLTDPSKFGADPATQSFHVVVPTMPGFGFSDRPTRPFTANPVGIFHDLMTRVLGYESFLAAGTDIGARVATRLALAYPEVVRGIHVATVDDPVIMPGSRPLSRQERAYLERSQRWDDEEGAYSHVQSTRPQTLAYALADSPVGLASWIAEKYYFWSDHEGDVSTVFPLEALIDTVMIYWLTGTIGSSMRHYKEAGFYRPAHREGERVRPPTGIIMLPRDLAYAPREWAERLYNVQRYTLFERGGHFPAWEVPMEYAKDIAEFAARI